MRVHACLFAVLVGLGLGCGDLATIGGLCLHNCNASGAPARGVDAATEPDANADRTPDAGPMCSEGSHALSAMPQNLMLLVDDSASFAPWWPAMNEGLLQFLQDPEQNAVGIGLQRFDEICEADPYAVPLVPIAPLQDNRQALLQALPLPGTISTSTLPALEGVLRYARDWSSAHDNARVAVVLLTDASPGACDGFAPDIDAEAQRIARAGVEGVPSIATYVIGFSTLPLPSSIARGAGTDPILISVTPADGEVRAALERVRRTVQPCAFRLQPGWTIAAGASITVSQRNYPIVANAAACGQQDGFYVDDPATAYPLHACPRTCDALLPADRLTLSRACSEP
ncbi:MAG TPA: vWA domain-containing protein [Polyangiales bacterium]|nr:vWA domain-containing protein [Polyangiales bacterium]